jgi:hypothetical protein
LPVARPPRAACLRAHQIDLSSNRLESIPPEIFHLRSLERVNLSKNDISNAEDVGGLFENCPRLQDVDGRKNPICSQKKYWETLVVLSPPSLRSLDGKEVDQVRALRERPRLREGGGPAACLVQYARNTLTALPPVKQRMRQSRPHSPAALW